MISLLEQYGIRKSQQDVDFILPFLNLDRRYFLDPSLLRFSKNGILQAWHTEILDFMDLLRQILQSGDKSKILKLLSVGEASEAGLGYCVSGVAGNGVGQKIAGSIMRTITVNPHFGSRGLIRLEELQWLDLDMGGDRVSDLAISILKRHIIRYTQEQCRLHGIPTFDARIEVFFPDTLEWGLVLERMPVNPLRTIKDTYPHPPVLLIPKEALRPLPLFLNYDDFYGFVDPEFRKRKYKNPKRQIVDFAIRNPQESERYIKARETEIDSLYRPDFDKKAVTLCERLDLLPTGAGNAKEYRDTVERLINYIFKDLEFWSREQPTLIKDMKRDIIFLNRAKSGIFSKFLQLYKASHIVVDAKNSDTVTPDDISRVADYLNSRIGMVAFIVSRKPAGGSLYKHIHRQLVDNQKVVLFISDEDLKRWARSISRLDINNRPAAGADPLKSIERKYSELATL